MFVKTKKMIINIKNLMFIERYGKDNTLYFTDDEKYKYLCIYFPSKENRDKAYEKIWNLIGKSEKVDISMFE